MGMDVGVVEMDLAAIYDHIFHIQILNCQLIDGVQIAGYPHHIIF